MAADMTASNTAGTIPAVHSRGHTIGGGTTAVMGILNVTPNSFSDGGLWQQTSKAIAHGVRMFEAGAAVVDVGGESTGPKAARVSTQEELRRIEPVVKGLVDRGVVVSIDTVRADVAKVALDLGAAFVNDVSGGIQEPTIVDVCRQADSALVVQHWRGFPADPELNQDYGDVVEDVVAETLTQVQAAEQQGLPPDRIIIDPGLGFALRNADSWALVDRLSRLTALHYPVLVGPSRKRFIRARYGEDVERGTLDVVATCARAGVWAVRVHEVGPAVRLLARIRAEKTGDG